MSESREVTKTAENMAEKDRDIMTVIPLVDIYESEDEILLHADMPGVVKENISVNIDNGKLEIIGNRKLETKGAQSWQEFGDVEYKRVFSVPQSIDVSQVRAELTEGVLRLHLPKAEAAKPRTIEISSI